MFTLLLGIQAAGCSRLSSGNLADLSQPDARRHSVGVCVIRGYLDWYSAGLDELVKALRASNIPAQAFREEQWGDLAVVLVRHPQDLLILIGFSYGADDVILISRRLNESHRSVDLLITIDPVTPDRIPPNVKRTVNFYEPNGPWDLFPWLRGVPVTGDSGTSVENVNIRARADLAQPDTSHATIAANAKVHAAINSLVAQTIKSMPRD